MKIHAIKLKNLNSLYGEHAINFDTDLAKASLFLIHGPTGAGKSTVLDAVSLALFGKTPRLDSSRTQESDPRLTMSRGTADAFAEVEFSKISSAHERIYYRARYRVARARKSGEGKLQNAHRSLEVLRGDSWHELTSDHRYKFYGPAFSEVLEGFTAEDFQRSMLLAQGQFDAFLNASSDERASLLERLTDTRDYLLIGRRASELAKAYRRRRASVVQGGLTQEQPVSEVDWKEAQVASTQAEARSKEHQHRVSEAEICVNWAEKRGRLLASQLELEKKGSVQLAERVAAADDLTSLCHFEDLAPLFKQQENGKRIRGELKKIGFVLGELAKNTAETDRLREQAENAQEPLARCTQMLRNWLTASEAAFAELRLQEQQLSQAQASARLTQAESERHQKVAEEKEQQYAVRQQEAKASSSALTELARKLHVEFKGLSPSATEDASGAADLLGILGLKKGEEEAHLVELRDRHKAIQSFQASLAKYQEAQGRLKLEHSALQDSMVQLSGQASAVEHLVQKQEQLQERINDKVAAEELLAQTLPLLNLRKNLKEGESCPLCGSESHPLKEESQSELSLRQNAETLRLSIKNLKADFQQGIEAQQALRNKLAGLEASIKERERFNEKEAQSLKLEAQRLQSELEQFLEILISNEDERKAWMADNWLERQPSPALSALPARLLELSKAAGLSQKLITERLEFCWEQLNQQKEQARTLSEALLAEKQHLLTSQESAHEAAQRAAQHHRELKKNAAAVEVMVQKLGIKAQELEQEWQRQAEKKSEGSFEQLLTTFSNQIGAAPLLELEKVIRLKCETFEGELHAGQQQVIQLNSRRLTLQEQVQQRENERVNLEENFRQYELAFIREAFESEALRKVAEKFHVPLSRELMSIENVLDEAQLEGMQLEKLRTLKSRLNTEEHELKTRLDERKLSLKQLDSSLPPLLFSVLETKLASQRQKDELQGSESASFLELPLQLSAQLTADLGEQLKQELSEFSVITSNLSLELKTAQERFILLKNRRDAAKKEAEALARFDHEAEIWLRLDSLIGTGEGAAFQKFAQALNLRRLMEAANRHLQRLSARYLLEQELDEKTQMPTLEFRVCDLYQVGTTRSTKSLSGGERFLVSLSLALGLSDLRTRSLPIETLLLDEGFGTLDSETLEMALSALEYLKSDGRVVGIISHVEALKARIPAQIRVKDLGGGRSELKPQLVNL